MGIHVTRWRPDTCGCDIEYEWDDALPLESRTLSYHATRKTCAEHAGLSGVALYTAIVDNNQRKNRVHGYLLEDNDLAENFTAEDGQVYLRFKQGIGFGWQWTGADNDRVLEITVFGISLTIPQRNKIQNWLDNNFGAGKVILV